MLINESRFTPLTNNVKNQIKRLINIFVKNFIEKKGKLSNLTLDQAKQNVKKMISRSKENEIYIGTIDLGKSLNKLIPVFIKETGSAGTYYDESDSYYEHIVIGFDTIFQNLDYTLSTLAHEVIHAVQIYKKGSDKYYEVSNKIIENIPLSKEENFIYYTEPKEFEANASQLSYIITKFYERKDVNKEKVLSILDNVLKLPKERAYKFVNSFYIRYVMTLPDEDQDIIMSYLKDMFLYKLEFIKSISDPPDNKIINIKKSNKYWRQFKQKLFNLVQNLKKRQLKLQKRNK